MAEKVGVQANTFGTIISGGQTRARADTPYAVSSVFSLTSDDWDLFCQIPLITIVNICNCARVADLGQTRGGKLFDRKSSRAHCGFIKFVC